MSFDLCTKTIAQVLDETVANNGERTAYGFRGVVYSWNDIDSAVGYVTEVLRGAGIGVGSHVGICAPNSLAYLAVFYAAQRLGAVAVLMNRDDSLEEIAHCCRLANVNLFCYSSGYRQSGIHSLVPDFSNEDVPQLRAIMDISGKSEHQFEVIPVNPAAPAAADALTATGTAPAVADAAAAADAVPIAANPSPVEIDCHSDACILFTSGSTGDPKAVRLSHFSMLNTAINSGRQYHLSSSDRMCLALPLFHCFGIVFCVLSALCTATPIYVAPSLRTRDVLRIIGLYHCTVFHAVPTLFLAIERTAKKYFVGLTSVRTSTLAGAALTPEQYQDIEETFPYIHFMSSFGQTETSPSLTFTDYDDTLEHLCHTVGKPMEGVELQVVECQFEANGSCHGKSFTPCPTGAAGEIVARGYCLMNGYMGLPESAQPIDADGWLHTGDLGFFDEEGYLHLTGRIKEIIIRGGENISPLEVEKEIMAYGSIVMCKVFGVPHEFYGEEVVACLKLENGTAFDQQDLATFLEDRLAGYKIPAHFYIFDRFPMTPAGKLDVQALRATVIGR